MTSFSSALLAGALLVSQVTSARLLRSDREPNNWLSYSGSYRSQRHSLLKSINTDNVKNLQLQWIYQARSLESFEATPLVVDGVIYVTEAPNTVVALDAKLGRVFWVYRHKPSPQAHACCGNVNRGLAILGDTLFMATLDGYLLALDSRTGRLLWSTAVSAPRAGYTLTLAPLVIKDKVIIGTAGGEYGIRGFLAAYDARTGKEAWRFNCIPGPGEPGHETWSGDAWKRGGGSVWVTGSYDPELDLTYWGIGNPGPDYQPEVRPGDNLYSNSVVALNPSTGRLAWHFQFSPHDRYDYDATQIPVLADIEWKGQPRKVLLWANRNGFLYVLDRTNGAFLHGTPIDKVTWTRGLDPQGRPVLANDLQVTADGTRVFPGSQGVTNWYSPSYSPSTGLFYVPTWVGYSTVFAEAPADYQEGRPYLGAALKQSTPAIRRGPLRGWDPDAATGAIRAFDPSTGKMRWEFKMDDVTDSGILTTASDLLFSGGREGYFYALDARTGESLWKFIVGGQVSAGPMSYAVDGKQYVSIAAGNSLFTFGLPR